MKIIRSKSGDQLYVKAESKLEKNMIGNFIWKCRWIFEGKVKLEKCENDDLLLDSLFDFDK